MLTATSIEGRILFPLSELLGAAAVPDDIAELDRDTDSFLNSVYFADSSLQPVENGFIGIVVLVVLEEIVIAPFGDVAGLVIGGGGGVSIFEARVRLQRLPGGFRFEIGLYDVAVGLRISPTILRPLKQGTNEPEPPDVPLDIQLGAVSIAFGTEEPFSVTWTGSPSIPRCMIGESGVIISAGAIRWLTPQSENLPADTPPAFLGMYLDDVGVELSNLELDSNPSLFLDYAFIGRGGFSGRIDLQNLNLSGSLVGFTFTLQDFGLTLVQNSITASNLAGRIELPFVDHPLGVQIGLNIDGGFTVALSSVQPAGTAYEGGLVKVHKEGLMDLSLESIRFALDRGVFTIALSGDITPLVYEKEIDWPTFHVDNLVIDSRGNARLEGGWLDLSQQKPLEFYGFQLAITKLGFGQTDDGGKWIGFSGGIKLVEGLPMGASVEGLRVTWYDDGRPIAITLNGVGVEFTVPNVLEFKGAVAYNTIQTDGRTIHRFDGAITLKITTINLEIDGVLVIGSDIGPEGRYTFFAIYTGVELPTGIPLGNTSLAIYGFAGLFAYQMEPNKGTPPNLLHPDSRVDEGWYDNEDGSPGWYKRGTVGVTDLKSKWDPVRDSLALGVGATLGTLPDGGTAFHGKFLLAIVFPGPIIMLEGRGNLLKKRADSKGKQTTTSEPLFRSISVLDFRLGTLTFGLMAWYKYDDKGGLIDITGSAEAFFDFNNPGGWHVYIGRDAPQQYRVHAFIFKKLFEANSYFMLDKRGLKTGAWVGFKYGWNYGPLVAKLEASLDGRADVNHRPAHFHGRLLLVGNLQLTAFGFGATIIVEAEASADVIDPYHILLRLSGELKLPWPLPSFKKEFKREWGPLPVPPPLPLPLKEIAIEHPVVSTTWPLPRDEGLLRPVYDDGNGFLLEPQSQGSDPAHALIPVVPLDARPHLNFARHINDDARIGSNPQPGSHNTTDIWERIGDPEQNQGPALVRFGLRDVVMEKWDSGAAKWSVVASASGAPRKLSGAWAPVPGRDGGVTQNRLMLSARNAFDYTRHGGRAWSEGFAADNPTYPCIPDAPEREICCDFSDLQPGQVLHSPWQCQEHPEITLTWSAGGDPVVTVLDTPVNGLTRALCFPGGVDTPGGRAPNDIVVSFPAGTPSRKVTVTPPRRDGHTRQCLHFEGRPPGPGPNEERGVQFITNGAAGSQISAFGAASGLDCGRQLVFVLPRACLYAELTLSTQAFNPAHPPVVEAHRRNGLPVFAQMQGSGPELLRLHGPDIVDIIVHAPAGETLLHQLCLEYVLADGEARDGAGSRFPAIVSDTGILTFEGDDLQTMHLTGDERVCLVQVCAVLPPDPGEVAARQAMTQHFQSELARWYQEDDLLELNTIYRLTIVTAVEAKGEGELSGWQSSQKQTQYAYFRTEGPPGLGRLALPAGTAPDGQDVLRTPGGKIITVDEKGQVQELDSPDQLAAGYRFVFKSALNDLTPYVRQTVPPTVPAPGQLPPLPRPVYRAYDTGVEFNANYVDLMYRLQRRGLALYLVDNNNRPARDAEGRLIVLANRWGASERLWLTESELLWISRVNANDCATLDPEKIARNKLLTSSHPDLVLDPDTVYEARLIPLFLDDDFSQSLDAWRVVNQGDRNRPADLTNWKVRKSLAGPQATAADRIVTLDGAPDLSTIDVSVDVLLLDSDQARPSRSYRIVAVDNTAKKVTLDAAPKLGGGKSAWRIPLAGVEQRSAINGGPLDGRDPNKPGTILLAGDASWSDYRFGVTMRSWRDGALGVVFRVQDSAHYYRFSMSRDHRYRRLVRVRGAEHRILGEDYFVFQTNCDYRVTVEAVGDRLHIYLDDVVVFDVNDDALPKGGIGLYCWDNAGARFTDVRVDDFREDAPVVYRYEFTTSRFANFFHHLHSFQDETWTASATETALKTAAANAALLSSPPSEKEARAYQNLLDTILPGAYNQNPPEVQVTRIEQGGQAHALLVQSPEPIDWRRATLELEHTARPAILNAVPGAVKLTHAQLGGTQPNDEWVDLLVREPIDLSGYRIEYRAFPGAQPEPADAEILFADSFNQLPAGLLFEDIFGPNTLDRYTIMDEEPPGAFPSNWKMANNRIEQQGRYLGGSRADDNLPKRPGTIALLEESAWSNVRISVVLHSQSLHDIGLVFRCQDQDNYYRFSASRFPNAPVSPFRRLVKKVAGQVHVLWEDDRIAATMDPCRLVIETFGDRLIGYLNDELLFNLHDPSFSSGKVGFYCWNNNQAWFEELKIEALEADPVLWQPAFQDLSEIIIMEEPNTINGPAKWHVQAGTLIQSSEIAALEGTLELMPGAAYDIAVSPDGLVAVVGVDPTSGGFGVYVWGGADWYRVGEDAVRIAAGLNDTLVWITNFGQVVVWRQGFLQPLPITGSDIAIGASGFVGLVGTDPAPGGFNVYYSDGANLQPLGRGALRVAVGPDNRVWVVDDAHQIFVFDGINWQELPGAANDIAVGADGAVWIVSNTPNGGDFAIQRWTGQRWETMFGAAVGIAVAQDGNPWCVDSAQRIWRWQGSPYHQPGTYALGGDQAWQDVLLSTTLRSDSDGAIGVMFRYQDGDNYYRFAMDRTEGIWRLIKRVNGTVDVLEEQAWQYRRNQRYELTLSAVGSELRGYMDGNPLFTHYDGDLRRGQVGLYCRQNDAAYFERLVVADRTRRVGRWTIHDEGDQDAPSVWRLGGGAFTQTSAIRGGAAEAPGACALAGDPSWTDILLTVRLRSDDPGAIGVIFRYVDADNHYRFSMNQASHNRRLIKKTGGSVTILWEDTGRGYNVGEAYILVAEANGAELVIYLGDTRLCTVTDETHSAGQIGLYCANNPGARFEDVEVTAYPVSQTFTDYLLEDIFDDLVPGRWSFEDRGNAGGSSNWSMSGGELRQSGNIRFRPRPWVPGPSQPATLALAGDLVWTDYRLSVVLGSYPVLGGNSDEIGVVFRYQNADNYYWFAMNHQTGMRQLLRRVASQVAVLWQDNASNDLGKIYQLNIDCLGQNLRGYLNGALLFDLVDRSLPSGRVGLACTANSGAFFAEIRVIPPTWRLHYRFRDERRLPVGTRIRIFSGSVRNAPSEEANVGCRFVAAPYEPGRLHFLSDGVDIRLRATGQLASHMRRFLNYIDAYKPIDKTDWRMLRKADGTGLFLLKSPSSSSADLTLQPGQYRLKLEYKRDNRSTDSNSQVYSQGGDGGSEIVVIDIS